MSRAWWPAAAVAGLAWTAAAAAGGAGSFMRAAPDAGAQIWRTADGLHWEMVVGDGFGQVSNVKVESLLRYADLLYAATYNSQTGVQVWRSADGITWEQVIANGFDDSSNYATLWSDATVQYQGKLFIGTWNTASGGEVWRFAP